MIYIHILRGAYHRLAACRCNGYVVSPFKRRDDGAVDSVHQHSSQRRIASRRKPHLALSTDDDVNDDAMFTRHSRWVNSTVGLRVN